MLGKDCVIIYFILIINTAVLSNDPFLPEDLETGRL